MVLSGMHLIDNPAHSGFIRENNDKQIFAEESDGVV